MARRFLMAASIVVLTILVIAAGLTLWGLWRFNDIAFVDIPGVEPAPDGTPANWLLIGTDGREGIDPDSPDAGAFLGEQVVGKRTDTIMLARVDADSRLIDLLSVPRDLWVPIAGRDQSGRINGAYNGDDGRQRLVATLSAALGVEINHYAEVNFVGFAQIVDALDGVPLFFSHPARDAGSGLDIIESGCHIVDGSQALAFARARTYEELVDGRWRLEPTGDLGRTARQRYFLTQVIETATGKIGVSSLGTLDEVLKVAGQNLVVEDGATVTDMFSLARTFATVDSDRIVGHALPVEDIRTGGGAQVLGLRQAEAEPVLEIFRNGPPPSLAVTDDGSDDSIDGSSGSAGQPDDGPQSPAPALGSDRHSTGQPQAGYGRFGFSPAMVPDGTPCG